MPTAYDTICASIEGLTRFAKKNDLRHTRECLERLGNPDRDFAVIHVAGTNGKGSVCAMLASALRESGHRVGLFISPHLITTRERFNVDGTDVTEEAFTEAYGMVKTMTASLERDGLPHPSYFEFLFLMGMVIFRKAGIEVAVLETGLGGRFDATNVVEKPDLTVITAIGLDHTQYLGTTLSQIAGEKAGIIKAGIPVVYDDTQAEASRVIREKAQALEAPAYPVNRSLMTHLSVDDRGTTFEVLPYKMCPNDLIQNKSLQPAVRQSTPSQLGGGSAAFCVPIPALYEADNAALAIYACRLLREKNRGFYGALTDEAIRSGLAKVRWPGRMERLEKHVYVDGAHNPAGVRAFIETVKAMPDVKAADILFSVMGDKDYKAMIRDLVSAIRPHHVTLVSVSDRSASLLEIADLFRKAGVSSVSTEETVPLSYARAKEKATPDKEGHYLFCLGSLYFAGDLKSCLI